MKQNRYPSPKGHCRGRRSLAPLFAVALCAPGTSAHADTAIVIGINEYKNMPGQTLGGCINDANRIADVLRDKQHFQVEMRTNTQATKQNIKALFEKIKKSIASGERLVFFFAGHGAPDGYILPHDAKWDGTNCFKREELRRLVADIPARSRTIILDACFSETMIQKGLVGLDTKVRGVILKNMPLVVNRATEPGMDDSAVRGENAEQTADVCYWTAAACEQASIEMQMPTPRMIAKMRAENLPVSPKSMRDGVFSYFAAQELSKDVSTWSELNTRVRLLVQNVLQEKQLPNQWPIVSNDYTQIPIFESKTLPARIPPAKRPPAPKHSLWAEFAGDRFDPKRLRLEVTPNRAVVHKNEEFTLSIHIGMQGYLVIIDQNEKGQIHLVYPQYSINVEDAMVSAEGDPKMFDKAKQTEEGSYHVRALLFRFKDKDRALKLLRAFAANRTIEDSQQANEKSLELGREASAPPFTADLLFQVLPEKVGGISK